MASTTTSKETVGNPVPHDGDHDRVAMLSLRADGTPSEHNPEIIGDKDYAVSAAKRQFAEQAVSAVDAAERGASAGTAVEDAPQDPSIEDLKGKQDAAAKKAEAAAEKTVNALHKG